MARQNVVSFLNEVQFNNFFQMGVLQLVYAQMWINLKHYSDRSQKTKEYFYIIAKSK